MRTCPSCGELYPINVPGTCPVDGAQLVSSAEYAASRNDALLGATLAERYEIVGRVGVGGMGTVYRARQVGLAREVALKVLRPESSADRDTVARFEREAKAMSLLLHTNTVRVFDFGEDPSGYLYLAMELLEGEPLTARIEREGALDVEDAIAIARQILGSLAEAHGKGLIHRDLKPDNIFLARIAGQAHPVVKVLDFGIAKIFRDDAGPLDALETQAGTVFGTPRYMSPEQAQGRKLDPRSDVYAVGVLLYQMLVGRPPFVDSDAVVVMSKHIRETPRPPREVAPAQPIPRSLEDVVQRALAKHPRARPSDAAAFDAELSACLSDVEHERALAAQGLRSADVVFLAGVPVRTRTAKIAAASLGAATLALALAIVLGAGASSAPHARSHGARPTPVGLAHARAPRVETAGDTADDTADPAPIPMVAPHEAAAAIETTAALTPAHAHAPARRARSRRTGARHRAPRTRGYERFD